MRKPDELRFYRELYSLHGGPHKIGLMLTDDVALVLGVQTKRAFGLLEKWTRYGWWDYGVSLRTGWFTEAAPKELQP